MRQSKTVTAESLRTFLGWDDFFGLGEYRAASMIKVIEMMIVAEENLIEATKRVRGQGGT